MQINLSSTTHSLELETLVAGSVHYQLGYTDITATGVSLPQDEDGIITTATTTIIATTPSATTTRKIQYLNVYNNGVSNTITIKKDVSGTEYILQKISLQKNENFRIVNDKVEVFDASGRVKLQTTGDTEIAGDSRVIFKVGTAPEAAGQYYCFAKDSGSPGAWLPGTPGINGRNTDGTTVADRGCISAGTPISGINYIRDIVTTATTNAAAIANITLSYTNSEGVVGRTGTMSYPATAVIGTFVPFQLAEGDIGIRSIQSITLGTSLTAGAVSLICSNFLAISPVPLANVGSLAFQRKLDLKLNNEHCLLPFWLASTTIATNLTGAIYFINK